MMVTTGGHKGGLPAETLLQFESQYIAVKSERALQVGDLQMHVADPNPLIDGLLVHGRLINICLRLRPSAVQGGTGILPVFKLVCRTSARSTSPRLLLFYVTHVLNDSRGESWQALSQMNHCVLQIHGSIAADRRQFAHHHCRMY